MEFLSSIASELISIVSIIVTGFVGWLFGRRKTRAEIQSKEIDNDIKLSKHYAKILDDLEARYKEKYNGLAKLYDSKEKALKEEIRILKRRVTMLKRENTDLRRRIKTLEKE